MSIPITLTNLVDLQNETSVVTAINANNATITTALVDALSRSGQAPDQMTNNLDMNSQQIINLPNPATTTSPLRLQDLNTFIGGGTITNIPAGGTTGQVLSKHSNTNYDVDWENSVHSVGLALPADFTVTNSPVTNTGTLTGAWVTPPTGTGAVVRATSPAMTTPTITSPTLVTPVLGTPTSGTLTNATGLPISTGVSGLATGVATFLGTPTSANLFAALTDKSGTGTNVFNNSPALITPALGTPTAVVLTSGTGLPLTTGVTGTLPTANGGTNLTSATDVSASFIHRTLSCQNNGSTNGSSSGSGAFVQHTPNFTLPANYLIANRALRVSTQFSFTSGSAPPTLDIQIRMGGVVVATFGPGTPGPSLTNNQFGVMWLIQGTSAPSASSGVFATIMGSNNAFASNTLTSTIANPFLLATNGTLLMETGTKWGSVGTGTTTIQLIQFIVEAIS